MKIALNYDPAAQQITTNDGALVTNCAGLEDHEIQDEGAAASVDNLVCLRNAGFDAEDIIAMSKAGII